jgi:hypothetical protein
MTATFLDVDDCSLVSFFSQSSIDKEAYRWYMKAINATTFTYFVAICVSIPDHVMKNMLANRELNSDCLVFIKMIKTLKNKYADDYERFKKDVFELARKTQKYFKDSSEESPAFVKRNLRGDIIVKMM